MNIAKFNKPDDLLPEDDYKTLKNMVLDIYQTTPLEILYNIDFNAYDFILRTKSRIHSSESRIHSSESSNLKRLLIKYDNQYLFYYIMYFMYDILEKDIKANYSNWESNTKTYKNKLELTPELLIGDNEDVAFKRQELGYLRNKYLHNNQFRDQVDSRVNNFIFSDESTVAIRH